MGVVVCPIDKEGNCIFALKTESIHVYAYNERCNCLKITRGDGSVYTYPRKERVE